MDTYSRHDQRNLEAENRILRRQLDQTADQLDDLVESDCDDSVKSESERVAKRAHKMARS